MVQEPGLVWPIKASFVGYIERMRDGAVVCRDGCIRRDDGAFFFPLTGSDGDALVFGGSVHFSGHFGMLSLELGGIRIEPGATASLLTVADADEPDGRRAFAQLEPGADGVAHPALTADGAELFFDNYRAGTALDALELTPAPRPVHRPRGSAT